MNSVASDTDVLQSGKQKREDRCVSLGEFWSRACFLAVLLPGAAYGQFWDFAPSDGGAMCILALWRGFEPRWA